MKHNLLFLAGLLFLSFPFYINAQSENWAQFRGLNSSGIAAEGQEPPVIFSKEHNVQWNTDVSSGQSSPCIWQDNIFITGFEQEEKLLKMYCIDRVNGKIKWQREIKVEEFEKTHSTSSPANATPATDGERVVFYFSSYGLLCYSLKGELLWERTMPIPTSRHGMGTSPIIANDLVILNCFGHGDDPCLLALDKTNGKTIWKHSVLIKEGDWTDSYSTPVVYNDQIIIYRDKGVAGYDINNGNQIWNYPTGLGDAVCTPIIGDNVLYFTVFSTFGNQVMLEQFPDFKELTKSYDVNQDDLITKEELFEFEFIIYPEKGEVSGTIRLADYFHMYDKNKDNCYDSAEWNAMIDFCESFIDKQGIKAIKLGGEGDISLNNFLWGNSEHVPHVTSPLYYNNLVYMVKSGGILSCFDAANGNLIYRERLGAAGAYFASPIIANDKIYFNSRNGVVTIVEAGSSFKILGQNDLDEEISATPAIVDDKIFVRTVSSLYAFGE